MKYKSAFDKTIKDGAALKRSILRKAHGGNVEIKQVWYGLS